ncbi:MAG: hypothetical protein M0036_18845 [Desulfobacteraceae bacterium]|nr:hypothetical protein [Desulfobacteraceae bacterium]
MSHQIQGATSEQKKYGGHISDISFAPLPESKTPAGYFFHTDAAYGLMKRETITQSFLKSARFSNS